MPSIHLLYKTNTIQCTPLSLPLSLHIPLYLTLLLLSASICMSPFITHVRNSMTQKLEKKATNPSIPMIAPTIYYKKDIRPREPVRSFFFSLWKVCVPDSQIRKPAQFMRIQSHLVRCMRCGGYLFVLFCRKGQRGS